MDEEKLARIVRRIKHFFIQTGWSVDGIEGSNDDFSYSVIIPYTDLSKGFFRFINLITIRETYYINRTDDGYIIDFPKTDEEIKEAVGAADATTTTTAT